MPNVLKYPWEVLIRTVGNGEEVMELQHVKIKIYTTPTCPYCRKAKQYFKSLGLRFQEADVSRNPKELEVMYRKTRQYGVPVIEIGNQVIIGFDKNKIDRLLGIN